MYFDKTKWPDPHRQQTSTAQKQRESRIAFSNACAYITDTTQATTNDKQEWQIGKWKKLGKTMTAKAWVESIRQPTGCKSRLGKLATFPDVRLVYHESGRWKLRAGFQKEESREETPKNANGTSAAATMKVRRSRRGRWNAQQPMVHCTTFGTQARVS